MKRDTRFLYDGWNVIAEFESSAGVPLALSATYAWGLDLSGTETGAGGVGGLLFTKLHATPGSPVLAPCYDGNGNILAYLDCATGQTLARYEYDPFGKLLLEEEDTRVAGRLHHQFSTKYTDEETGLSYYGYRYYAPDLGRWPNRDPIGERGGLSLYAAVGNNCISKYDRLGHLVSSVDNEVGIAAMLAMNQQLFLLHNACSNACGTSNTSASDTTAPAPLSDTFVDELFYEISDEIERESREAKCRSLYQSYKSAADGFARNPCSMATTCEEIQRAIAWLGMEIAGRADYINQGCDSIIPTTKDHPGHLAQLATTMINCMEKAARLCLCK